PVGKQRGGAAALRVGVGKATLALDAGQRRAGVLLVVVAAEDAEDDDPVGRGAIDGAGLDRGGLLGDGSAEGAEGQAVEDAADLANFTLFGWFSGIGGPGGRTLGEDGLARFADLLG